MTDKERNEKELDNVNGGYFEFQKYRRVYKNKLDKYDTVNYIGQNLYFDRASEYYKWVFGTITDSYERSWGCGKTIRTAKVTVIDSEDYSSNAKIELDLDCWKAYSK